MHEYFIHFLFEKGTSMIGSSDFGKFTEAIERALVLHDYRSPSSLRAFATVFLVTTPIIFGPLYAFYSLRYGLMAGIYSAIITTLVLVSLYRIFMQEEDPLDAQGFDDLSLAPMLHFASEMHIERKDRSLFWLDRETKLLSEISKNQDVAELIEASAKGPLFLMRNEDGLGIEIKL